MGSKSKQKKQGEELPTGVGSEDRIEAKIDRDLKDSFPASDPPCWLTFIISTIRRQGARRHVEISARSRMWQCR